MTMSCTGKLRYKSLKLYSIYSSVFVSFSFRLNIKNAETLIHFFIPTHSKYDFSLRFSFALDRLKSGEGQRPVSHLLITDEFKNSLLTIVKIMPRFGHPVPDDLKTDAMLSYCDKEFSKTQLPLCIELKVLQHSF